MKHKKLLAVGLVTGAIVASGLAIKSTGGRIGNPDMYPTQAIGVVNPNVNQSNINQTICVSGWTGTIRPPATYTTNLKIQQMKALGLTGTTADYEEDHYISLELGGNPTDPSNLWPQPYNASLPDGGAKNKDSVENFLKKEVCSGTITLIEAQKEITSDWYKVLKTMPKQPTTFGSIITDPDDN